ncbi:MAG: hypothetical protein VBE63_28675, partial [Lamprobacter sp.]|uniref:hypothetical protein n=1 Tax=Lamprobacter sp. TaxID=3100796 RepID=UPI002B259845
MSQPPRQGLAKAIQLSPRITLAALLLLASAATVAGASQAPGPMPSAAPPISVMTFNIGDSRPSRPFPVAATLEAIT